MLYFIHWPKRPTLKIIVSQNISGQNALGQNVRQPKHPRLNTSFDQRLFIFRFSALIIKFDVPVSTPSTGKYLVSFKFGRPSSSVGMKWYGPLTAFTTGNTAGSSVILYLPWKHPELFCLGLLITYGLVTRTGWLCICDRRRERIHL